jgi:hypothetical protein
MSGCKLQQITHAVVAALGPLSAPIRAVSAGESGPKADTDFSGYCSGGERAGRHHRLAMNAQLD